MWVIALWMAQTPDPAVLYRAKCAVCHDERGWASAVLGRGGPPGSGVLTSRTLPADFTRVIIREGKATMPGFTPTEISDAEALAIAQWLERR